MNFSRSGFLSLKEGFGAGMGGTKRGGSTDLTGSAGLMGAVSAVRAGAVNSGSLSRAFSSRGRALSCGSGTTGGMGLTMSF
ncbi:hypothetical protein D3C86_1974950 [compost metagenome]